MKRTILSLLLSLSLLAPSSASAWSLFGGSTNYQALAQKVGKSVIRLTIGQGRGSCTAFSINEEKRLFISANHCWSEDGVYTSDGEKFEAVTWSAPLDVMLLRAPKLSLPALKAADRNAETGEEVMSVGYGYGLFDSLFRVGHVAAKYTDVNMGVPYMATDFALIPGMSGGPMVNKDGKVISINQLTTDRMGLGVPISTFRYLFLYQ